MSTKLLGILLLLLLTLNCLGQNKKTKSKITIFNSDAFYKSKKISFKLINFDDEIDGYESDKNTIFEIKQNNYITKNILKDSLFCRVQIIEFADFNNDKIKDILVQNISDVRSNWTYNLFLYNPQKNTFKRVEGFEEIKNPKYNSKYNIVESYVVSGHDWMGFYKIVKNKVHNYKIEIDNYHDEKFNSEYKKSIKRILKRKI